MRATNSAGSATSERSGGASAIVAAEAAVPGEGDVAAGGVPPPQLADDAAIAATASARRRGRDRGQQFFMRPMYTASRAPSQRPRLHREGGSVGRVTRARELPRARHDGTR